MAKRGMEAAARNLKAHKDAEAAPAADPICRHCGTSLDTQAQAQGSHSKQDGLWSCSTCIKAAAAKVATKAAPAPVVGMVKLEDQLTEKEAKKQSPATPKASLATVTIPAPAAGDEIDEKKAKMLQTLARAREIRAEQLKSGVLVAKVPAPAKAKTEPVKAAPSPVAQAVQPSDIERWEQVCARLEAVCDRLERVPATA